MRIFLGLHYSTLLQPQQIYSLVYLSIIIIWTGCELYREIMSRQVNLAKLQGALINMFAKCGRLKEAIAVWNSVSHELKKTPYCWNTMINACAISGQADQAQVNAFCSGSP